MSTNTQRRRTVQLDDDVYKELTAIGMKGEKYSDIIKRVLKQNRIEAKYKKASFEKHM